jgi:hypothetical protein
MLSSIHSHRCRRRRMQNIIFVIGTEHLVIGDIAARNRCYRIRWSEPCRFTIIPLGQRCHRHIRLDRFPSIRPPVIFRIFCPLRCLLNTPMRYATARAFGEIVILNQPTTQIDHRLAFYPDRTDIPCPVHRHQFHHHKLSTMSKYLDYLSG